MCACLVGWYWRHIHLCGGEREGRDENSTMRVELGKRLPSNRQPGYGGKEKREGDFFGGHVEKPSLIRSEESLLSR